MARGAVHLEGIVAGLGDLLFLVVKLVLNVAHDGFQQVLHGDDTGHAAVLVHHHGHLEVLFTHLRKQLAAFFGAGNKIRRTQQGAQGQLRRDRLPLHKGADP